MTSLASLKRVLTYGKARHTQTAIRPVEVTDLITTSGTLTSRERETKTPTNLRSIEDGNGSMESR